MTLALYTHQDMFDHRPGARHPERPERLQAVAGRLMVVRDAEEAGAAIQRVLTSSSARRVAVSDASTVLPLARDACAAVGAKLLEDPPTEELFDCDVGISAAQWGIAETGSLVLESGSERHRFVSLIPRVHVALLDTDRICETLGEALGRTRDGAEPGTVPSAVSTYASSPSRERLEVSLRRRMDEGRTSSSSTAPSPS